MGVGEQWGSPEFCEAFRRGDPWTLESIYWTYVDGVEHVLRVGFVGRHGDFVIPGVPDPDQRADLIQEVFLKAFAEPARRRFDVGLEYRPYLWTISRNVLTDHHRRSRRERQKVSNLPAPDADLVLAEEEVEPEWVAPAVVEIVERYVAGLGPPLSYVYEMRFVRGRSQEEVGRALGMSRQSVRTWEGRLKQGLHDSIMAASRGPHEIPEALAGLRGHLRIVEARDK